jgi:hypothetical protein
MSLNGFVFGVISVQLVPLLEAAGLATAAAVWVASMKGVAQFGGRVVEILFARNLRAITVGRIAVGVLPPSLLLLLAGTGSLPLIVAFTLLMGASQFWQMKMTPTTTVDPIQQKMFMLMPVIFTFSFLWAPAGLVVYWFVSNLLAIGQQYLTNRIIATPARPVRVKATGNAGGAKS